MSNAFAAEFDAMAHDVFTALSMADSAWYTPANCGVSKTCRVFVDHDPTFGTGFETRTVSAQVQLTVLSADFPELPEPGALFAIGSDRYIVDRVDPIDESRIACLVSREVARDG